MTSSLIPLAAALRDAVKTYPERAPLGAAATILNPLDYAWNLHAQYLNRYAPKGHVVEAIFLGMNPGPWGMAQTGIPFGSPHMVRDFLKIRTEITPPAHTHPKRPIIGIDCPTNEVSGERLWGAIRDVFQKPEAFFARFFVANYCPLAFQSASGGNLTPDKLPKALWQEVEAACRLHLAKLIETLSPQTVIGIGNWAALQAKTVIEQHALSPRVASILHPSPANPRANRGWKEAALSQLRDIGHPW